MIATTEYGFKVQFTEEHIRYAFRKFFARHMGIGLPIAWLLMSIFLCQRLLAGQMDLLTGTVLAVLVMGAGVLISGYIFRRHYQLSHFRKTGNVVSYEFSEDFFKAKSGLGSSELKWEIFKGIWIFPKVWLLIIDRAGYVTLPVDQMSNEVKDFLKRKIISVGGKIK